MQQENTTEIDFAGKLLQLSGLFKRKQYVLAEKLGVSDSYLSEVLKGREPGKQLIATVNLLYKEAFATVDISKEIARNPIDALSENAKELLEEFASRLDVKPADFIEQMLLRYGQKTFEALEQRKVEISSKKTVEQIEREVLEAALKSVRPPSNSPSKQ